MNKEWGDTCSHCEEEIEPGEPRAEKDGEVFHLNCYVEHCEGLDCGGFF